MWDAGLTRSGCGLREWPSCSLQYPVPITSGSTFNSVGLLVKRSAVRIEIFIRDRVENSPAGLEGHGLKYNSSGCAGHTWPRALQRLALGASAGRSVLANVQAQQVTAVNVTVLACRVECNVVDDGSFKRAHAWRWAATRAARPVGRGAECGL